MPTFAYTVSASFSDPAVAEEWIAWIRSPHMADVIAAGAASAQLVRLDATDSEAVQCEVRYVFADRAAFERYERENAPRLRAEGLEKFPLERGIRYSRTTGEILAAQ